MSTYHRVGRCFLSILSVLVGVVAVVVLVAKAPVNILVTLAGVTVLAVILHR